MANSAIALLSKYWKWILPAVLVGGLFLFSASHRSATLQEGSTYSHSPGGYGAWYQYFKEKNTNIERWQKPFQVITENKKSQTLLRISPQRIPSQTYINSSEYNWVKKGNRLISLGTEATLTEADFSRMLSKDAMRIKIDGRRRYKTNENSTILGDRFGAVIWREQVGQGEIIWVTTPYLAANAYQDYPDNFKLLSDLVLGSLAGQLPAQNQQPILIDEYLHGYKDAETIRQEVAQSVWHYFLQTPLLILFIQALIILIILLWAGNRRFGSAIAVLAPVRNNSEVYIEALASVLEKAESTDFVTTRLQEAELKQLYSKLALNDKDLSSKALISAWETQYPQSNVSFGSLLEKSKLPRSRQELKQWLEKWQKVKNE
ncbi:MAG: DUF4350 domain-containing protein [Microcystaceae cyanobacterium]